MISIELSDAATDRLNAWISEVGNPSLNVHRVAFNLLDLLQDRAAAGETLQVELGQQYTSTGRPETITFAPTDVEITNEADE